METKIFQPDVELMKDTVAPWHQSLENPAKAQEMTLQGLLKNYSQTHVVAFEGDEENVLADPLLVEYDRGVVTFAGDSPVFKLGIKPIDVSDAGRRKTKMQE